MRYSCATDGHKVVNCQHRNEILHLCVYQSKLRGDV